MPPSPIPAPLPLWAKAILQITPFVAGWLLDHFAYGEDELTVLNWDHVQVVYSRSTPATTTEDLAMFTIDIVNITGGAVDGTWTTTDLDQVDTALGAFTTSIKALQTNNHVLKEYRHYLRSFNSLDNAKPFAETGPPVRITPKTGTGTLSTGFQAYQVAATITELTPSPKHWGRLYIPGFGSGNIDSNGRIAAAAVSAMANAYSTLATSLQGNGFFPVVPITQIDKTPVRGLLTVSGAQVDDIPDVQRRRRASTPAIRTRVP